ncbi:uncharacterized protein LOC110248685 [Exaiptasia diaphana]|uniref:DDE Tnp4 domain-containing protein n=1 Tax=Exaiptasia diaphana TaxID=2652724 RepID=A0A913XVD6_EXADI|nr:uncharacterized protein LOC110248685 [Exaiptasia diaphana]
MGTEDDSLLKTFIKNDSKVSFYTGLPNKKCFELLEKHLSGKAKKMRYWAGSKKVISSKYKKTTRQAKRGPQRKLSIKQEMLLTMMKLRHYLANELLADLFHVSTSTVSQIFNTWIKFLRKEVSPLIYWPERESINQKLPDSVKKSHPNLRCTIDCTEIFIERPRDLKLRALTWSDYKKNNTVKFLVGIAPNGMINFLSKAWGGRTSDRHITIESGFLNKLEPGDLILADRGFTIREDILLRGATLTIPPPSSGLEQMTNKDVKSTKVIANSRIHVERAIGRMKHFEIVNNTLSITLLPVIDDIVIVCACLCNLLPPLTGW